MRVACRAARQRRVCAPHEKQETFNGKGPGNPFVAAAFSNKRRLSSNIAQRCTGNARCTSKKAKIIATSVERDLVMTATL
jgi:hypothetical protein